MCLCVDFFDLAWNLLTFLILLIFIFCQIMWVWGIFFFNVYLFLGQRETEHEWGRGREGGRHRIWNSLQALSCQHRTRHGAGSHELRDHDWAEVGCLTSWTTQAPLIFIFFNVYLFLTGRKTKHEWRRGREGGRHRIWSRLQALSFQHRAPCGTRTHRPWDHDLSWSPTLNWLSHPGAPSLCDFLKIYLFWQRERVGEGQRERETQNLKQAPGSELSAQSLT